MSFFSFSSFSRLAICALVAVGAPSCSFFRGDGTKQRLDEPRELPHHPVNVRPRTMMIEATTDVTGAVVGIVFKRGSGSDAVDNYVAENLRHAPPGNPSTRSLIELTYSAEKGFSEPKLVSSSPAL